MSLTTNRLDADLYQLTGEDAAQEHIAGSGALSIAGLYANHGSDTAFYGTIAESEPGMHQAATTYREPVSQHQSSAPMAENYYSSLTQAMQSMQQPKPAVSSVAASDTQPVASNLFSLPPASTPVTAQAASPFSTSANGSNGANGADGNDGTNGTNGVDGQPGSNGTPGSNGDHGHDHGGTHCDAGGHGDVTITINHSTSNTTSVTNINNETHYHAGDITIDHTVNNVTNVVSSVTNVVNHTVDSITNVVNSTVNHVLGTLIDIDIGGVHHVNGNDNQIIDLNLGGHHHVTGNDNDILDIGLGGASHIGGNDNDVIDLGLFNQNHVTGNDNDILDIGLDGASHIGGNDNDLIDLGLFNQNHVAGNDNDLIDLGLNDHGSVGGSDHNLIGLDLGLFDNSNGSTQGDLLGGGIDLLNDQGLANVDLSLGNHEIAQVNASDGGLSLSLDLGVADLHLDTGDLLHHDASQGLLPDTLHIDLGLLDSSNNAFGSGDHGLLDVLGLNNDASHAVASHGGGTNLGLQLGLGAWL